MKPRDSRLELFQSYSILLAFYLWCCINFGIKARVLSWLHDPEGGLEARNF